MGAWDLKEPEIPYNGDDGKELKNDEKTVHSGVSVHTDSTTGEHTRQSQHGAGMNQSKF